MEKSDLYTFIYKYKNMEDKGLYIKISSELLEKYKKILNENGMSVSKRLKLLIKKDIEKLMSER